MQLLLVILQHRLHFMLHVLTFIHGPLAGHRVNMIYYKLTNIQARLHLLEHPRIDRKLQLIFVKVAIVKLV